MSKQKPNDFENDGSWHYQAVYKEHQNDLGGTYQAFTICEVYLDEKGRLKLWTKNTEFPCGSTIDELTQDLESMLEDISSWKPVEFDKLKIGMVFEKVAGGI